MAKWYWILAAACLIGTVGITASTYEKAHHRNVELMREEGLTAAFNGRWEEASNKLGVVIEEDEASARDWFMYGYALHHQRQFSQSIKIFEKAEKMGYTKFLTQYNIACGYSLLGKTDLALDHLENSVEAGWVDTVWLREDSDLEPLHGKPRFEEIVQLATKRLEEEDASPPKNLHKSSVDGTKTQDLNDQKEKR